MEKSWDVLALVDQVVDHAILVRDTRHKHTPSLRSRHHRHGLPKPRRFQVRRRRRRLILRNQRRPQRAITKARSRNDRPRQGPLFLQEPRWKLRVQTMSHSPPERWLIPRPHTRTKTSDEPRTTSGTRAKGGTSTRWHARRWADDARYTNQKERG